MLTVGIDNACTPQIYIQNSNLTVKNRLIHLSPARARLVASALIAAAEFQERVGFPVVEIKEDTRDNVRVIREDGT